MTRAHISGCGGMLGQAFHEELCDAGPARCTDIDVNEDWLEYIDVRDFHQYRADVRESGADCLFHLGALTDLEHCETHPSEAYETNTLAVENAVHIANELHIPLLYVSTGGIFDGRKGLYDDWDTPHPLSVYGKTKWAGEQFVREHAERFLVCRAGWMMGGGPRKDKKFVHKLMRQLRDGRRELEIVDDKLGTPTYTRDFARNVRLLLASELWGVYNMACQGSTSRLEVARALVEELGLSGSVRLRPVPSEFFAGTYFAPRPESERLVNRRLALRGLDVMRPWREALRDYLRTDYADYLPA